MKKWSDLKGEGCMVSGMMSLYDAKKNGVFHVVSAPDIALLESLGLRNGTRILVQSHYSFGGPVLLRVENAFTIAIGKDIAIQIMVEEVAD